MHQCETTQNEVNQANSSGRPKGGRPVLPSQSCSPADYVTPVPELVWPFWEQIQPQEPIKGLTQPEKKTQLKQDSFWLV